MTWEEFYREIVHKIEDYRESLNKIGFALPEKQALTGPPSSLEDVLAAVDVIMSSSKELNQIFEHSPDSIFVADDKGQTLRVNQSFERIAQLSRQAVMGRNVSDIEAEGIFKPSVCRLALKEGRSVSVLQKINGGDDIVVTGVPVFDEQGKLFRVTTNAFPLALVKTLTSYLNNSQQNAAQQIGEIPAIIAESNEMKAILHLVDIVKNAESSVLLTGETGVGKSLLARYIHESSNRNKNKMMEINCGAIPGTLLESELFGYEGGAFTGADRKGKPGLIELSDGGTLFLDEISELPLLLQVKLLHFLQNKKLFRVGGTREISVDCRIIAGSNQALEQQMEAGGFRSDLYYRLNVIPITIPPLRERKADIEPAAQFFLEKYKNKYKKNVVLSKELISHLSDLSWRGNMRELENYIERLVVMNESNCVLEKGEWPQQDSAFAAKEGVEEQTKLSTVLRERERALILEAYQRTRSSYKVAKELGISQSTAHRKIKQYIALSQET